MRRTIETAPRDGNVIILEDDASGTYDVAHWSPEAGEWVGENGEPSKIPPSYWHPLPGENYFQQGQDISSSAPATRRGIRGADRAGRSEARATCAVAICRFLDRRNPRRRGSHRHIFRAEVVAYVTQHADQQDIFGVSTIGGQLAEQEPQLPSQDSRKTGSLAHGLEN